MSVCEYHYCRVLRKSTFLLYAGIRRCSHCKQMLVCWCTVSPYVQHPPFLALTVSNQCLTCEKRIGSKRPLGKPCFSTDQVGSLSVRWSCRSPGVSHPSLAFLTSAPCNCPLAMVTPGAQDPRRLAHLLHERRSDLHGWNHNRQCRVCGQEHLRRYGIERASVNTARPMTFAPVIYYKHGR